MDTIIKPNTTEVDFQKIVNFLKGSIPTYDKILKKLENNKGWLPLDSDGIKSLSKLDPPWCAFYENESLLKGLALHECFGNEEVNAESLNNLLEESTEEFNQSNAELNLHNDDFKQSDNQKDFSADEHQKSQPEDLFSLSFSLANIFNYLALMIHRRSMCQLISDAKNGNDDAFCLAVQIDRTVLQLPYFQQRLLKSQFSDDAKFLDKLASRIRTPILQSKIRYRTLTLMFSVLDNMNVLDSFTHEKLLDLCEEIGVTSGENGVNDVAKLRYQLHNYRNK